MLRIVIIALLLPLSVASTAQPGPFIESLSPPDTSGSERVSPVRAGLYSLGGTVLPMAAGLGLMCLAPEEGRAGPVGASFAPEEAGALLVLTGLVVGPSLGHFYAQDARQARLGLWVRGGATVVGSGAATVIVLDGSLDLLALRPPRLSRTGRIAEEVLLAAMATMAGSAVVDLVTAPLSARAFNQAESPRLRVGPQVDPSRRQVGMAVRLQL